MKKLIEKFMSIFKSKEIEKEIKVKPKEIKIAKKKAKKTAHKLSSEKKKRK